MRLIESAHRFGAAIKNLQNARYERGLRLREEQLFADLLPSYSILLVGIQQKLPKPPKELRSALEKEKKLWVTREMARIYIPEGRDDTIKFNPEQLNTIREVFARGYLEMTSPGGSLKKVAEALNIGWSECISLFDQTGLIITNSVLEEKQGFISL